MNGLSAHENICSWSDDLLANSDISSTIFRHCTAVVLVLLLLSILTVKRCFGPVDARLELRAHRVMTSIRRSESGCCTWLICVGVEMGIFLHSSAAAATQARRNHRTRRGVPQFVMSRGVCREKK